MPNVITQCEHGLADMNESADSGVAVKAEEDTATTQELLW